MGYVHINCAVSLKGEMNLYVLAVIILFGENERDRERQVGEAAREGNICDISVRGHGLRYNFFFSSFLECPR